ncbi:unnamed protein product [Mytilus edulis]|uniref:WSC domain-containing protein n=1 Tax=Mytilus edulis TaxID=6550 RepID=A0A8S3SQQ7_MYTED|nr:unnamed protein product [Mytilus edulis]
MTNLEYTTVSCLERCTSYYYIYAATKLDSLDTFECYCGNDIHFTTRVSGSQCGFPCPIIVEDVCGQINRIAVYDIRGESLPISIPAAEHTTEVSTSIIEPTTEVYTSTVERLSTTSALKVMTSIDNHKTIKTIENEKTSTVSPFVQSSEVASTVAKLKISTSTRSLIKDTMFTQSTSSISTSAVEGISSYSKYSSPSTSNQIQCMCPCSTVSTKWNFLADLDMSTVELKIFLNDYLNELKRNLTIDKIKTSAFLNRKISASDNRKSSVSIGYFDFF